MRQSKTSSRSGLARNCVNTEESVEVFGVLCSAFILPNKLLALRATYEEWLCSVIRSLIRKVVTKIRLLDFGKLGMSDERKNEIET